MSPATTATLLRTRARARRDARASIAGALSSATATQGPCVVTQLTLCHAGPAPSSRTERIARPRVRAAHPREERRLRVRNPETRTRARTARDRRRRTWRPALVSARRRRRSPPRIDPSGSRGTRPAAAAPTASAEASDRARRRAHRRRGGARRLVACRATRRAHRASRARQPSPRGTSTRARASIPLGASRARGWCPSRRAPGDDSRSRGAGASARSPLTIRSIFLKFCATSFALFGEYAFYDLACHFT